MGTEGPGLPTPRNRLQNGGLDLQEAPAIEDPAQGPNDLAPLAKDLPTRWGREQVQVAPPVPLLDVDDPPMLGGGGQQRLGQHGAPQCAQGGLAGPTPGQLALGADVVAEVELLQ